MEVKMMGSSTLEMVREMGGLAREDTGSMRERVQGLEGRDSKSRAGRVMAVVDPGADVCDTMEGKGQVVEGAWMAKDEYPWVFPRERRMGLFSGRGGGGGGQAGLMETEMVVESELTGR